MTETAAPPAPAEAAPQRERPSEGSQRAGLASGPAPAGSPRPAGRRPQRRYTPRRRVCHFCTDHVTVVDYKDISRLRRYLSDRAKIEPRRKTGTCAHHQRALATALKRARFLALLPYTAEHIRKSGLVLRP